MHIKIISVEYKSQFVEYKNYSMNFAPNKQPYQLVKVIDFIEW